jgi:hypothetical protein
LSLYPGDHSEGVVGSSMRFVAAARGATPALVETRRSLWHGCNPPTLEGIWTAVITTMEAVESPPPAEIQDALGELVGAAGEDLLLLSVGVGLRVVHELMEGEVAEIVGPKGKHNPDRTAKRHGDEDGSMTLGGRPWRSVDRGSVRPMMSTVLPVARYECFAARDRLQRAVMDRMLAGVSTGSSPGSGNRSASRSSGWRRR